MSRDKDSQMVFSSIENVTDASFIYSNGNNNNDYDKQDIVTNNCFNQY